MNHEQEAIQYERYAITIRKTKDPKRAKREDYIKRIDSIKRMGVKITHYSFESTSGIHFHGIAEIPAGFQMLKFRVRGWSTKLVAMFDEEQWIEYIKKDEPEVQDVSDKIVYGTIKKLKKPLWKYEPTDDDYKEFADWRKEHLKDM